MPDNLPSEPEHRNWAIVFIGIDIVCLVMLFYETIEQVHHQATWTSSQEYCFKLAPSMSEFSGEELAGVLQKHQRY